MTPEPENPESGSADRGVFGNLPSERPGVRSPRRQDEKRATAGKAAGAKATVAKPSARSRSRPKAPPARPEPRRASPPPAPPEPPASEAPSEPASQGRGIEDVAWAGVTV